MANTTADASAPRKRGGWLKKLGFVFGILIVLLVVLYLVATSSGFFKSFILPRVSKALGAEVTVSDASISPFSEVVLHNLKVQTTGSEPLVTAPEVHARYNLRDIMGGNIHVDELTLSSPTVVLVQNPDGSSNLDPITKHQKPTEKKPETSGKPATPSKPLQIDLRKIALTDATIRQLKTDKSGDKDSLEVSHLNLTVENVKNGQSGKLTVSAGVKDEKTSSKPDVSGVLEAKASGEYTFALSQDLAPTSVKGGTQLEISRAEGAFSDVAGGSLALDCEVTPDEIKQLALHLQKGAKRLGELRVSGPFSAEKKEGKLMVEILSIDRQLLNLAGAKNGIRFGTTTINSTNQVEIAKAGTLITTIGQMDVSKFQMKRASNSTPTLDLRSDYDVTVDLAQSNAVLRNLTITGMQGGNQLLHGELTSPMRIAWGGGASDMGDSAFTFTLTGLNLPDWKPFLGDSVSEGKVSAQAKILSQQAGNQLTFDIGVQADNLAARSGSNSISQAGIVLKVNGQATAMKQFNLKSYSLQLSHRKDTVLSVSGSGTYTKSEKPEDAAADMQLAVETFLPRLMELSPQPGSELSSGTVELKGHFVQKGTAQSITGNFALSDLTGNFGSNQFKNFAVTADLDVAMTPEQVQIHKATGKITNSGQAGGNFDVTGNYDRMKSSAQFTAHLTDVNESGLRPVLEPMLTDKKLVSVALGANVSIQYATNGPSAFKGDLQVTKLVVSDPKGQFPATPLEAKMQFDVSMNKQVTDIKQFQVTLTPTSRGKNSIELTGHVDATQTNAIQGNLKLAADSLDVTTYYDLFVGDKKGTATKTASASSSTYPGGTASASSSTYPGGSAAAPSGSSDQEPPAKQLPFKNFTADATVGKLYLREFEVSDAHIGVKIDGGHVVVNPFKLALNGAPVNATVDLDMSVPGYKYDVSFDATRVPIAPYIDSFEPERKGQLGGTFTANAGIKGQGTTGPNLQKYLSGKFSGGSTNLNLAVNNVKNPAIKIIVNVVATIPELLRNPASGVSSLIGGVLGLGKGGLTDQLSRSPIDAVTVAGQIGSGQVTLSKAEVRSVAFLADAPGTITLAPVLTNSALQIPVSISLARSLANQLGMTPANTPTNAPYVKLPDFVTIKGTIGVMKVDVDKLKVASMALQASGNGKIGGAVQGVTSIFSGSKTNGNAAQNLIQGVGGLLGGGNSNTNSGSNQQAAPVENLLNGLFGPKKK